MENLLNQPLYLHDSGYVGSDEKNLPDFDASNESYWNPAGRWSEVEPNPVMFSPMKIARHRGFMARLLRQKKEHVNG